MKPETPSNRSKQGKPTSSTNTSSASTVSKSSSPSSDIAGAPKEKKKISRLRTGKLLRSAWPLAFRTNETLGCWTCRRRGYKCDEGKPFCHNCTRLNLQCEGYGIRLKWQDDGYFRQHNKAKGKKSLTSKFSLFFWVIVRLFCLT